MLFCNHLKAYKLNYILSARDVCKHAPVSSNGKPLCIHRNCKVGYVIENVSIVIELYASANLAAAEVSSKEKALGIRVPRRFPRRPSSRRLEVQGQ